jgi:uncharacterized protein
MTTGAPATALRDADRADVRLRAGRLGAAELGELARRLAVLHEAETIHPHAERHAGPEVLIRRVQNLREEAQALEAASPDQAAALQEVADLQERFVRAHPAWFEARVEGQRIRSGASDLRLAEVWIGDDESVCFAGAESDAARRSRSARDACLPVAGLAVDLGSLGHPKLAERLLAAYAGESDDYGLYRVIDYHEREVACGRVRACLREASGPTAGGRLGEAPAAAEHWIALARAGARPGAAPAVVVALGGLVASGKSTVARAVAERLGAPRIVGDHVRAFRMGATPNREPSGAERLAGLEPGFDEEVSRALLAHAACVLDGGRDVVLDAGFPSARRRAAARRLAARHGAAFRFVECRVDEATARQRVAARDASPDDHGGWRAIYDGYLARWEPPGAELAPDEWIVVDTTRPLAETLVAIEGRLPGSPAERGA